MLTITEAVERYSAAEDAASKEYLEFWLEKFKTVGIAFTSIHPDTVERRWWHPHKAEFNGYKIDAYTWPSRYTGIKLNIFPTSAATGHPRYFSVKVKSEAGFKRLIRRLHNKEFV